VPGSLVIFVGKHLCLATGLGKVVSESNPEIQSCHLIRASVPKDIAASWGSWKGLEQSHWIQA